MRALGRKPSYYKKWPRRYFAIKVLTDTDAVKHRPYTGLDACTAKHNAMNRRDAVEILGYTEINFEQYKALVKKTKHKYATKQTLQ